MSWQKLPLKVVAPPEASQQRFAPEQPVWNLTLDQIESHTGRIINKQLAPASEAGSSTYVFDSGNVLYSKLRPYLNKVIYPAEAGIATTELVPLRPKKNVVDAEYLTYYLRSNYFLKFAEQSVSGARMPRIMMTEFWEHLVPLPPLGEQRRIVEILDRADDLRKKRAEADAKAERILPALFIKMFGDPSTNPMGWVRGKLGDVVIETQYGISTRANSNGEGFPILRMNNIDFLGRLDLSQLKYVVLEERELKKHVLKTGDILFNRTNSKELVGKTGLWKGQIEAVPASYLIRVRVDTQQVMPQYIWTYMNMQYMKQILFEKARRAIGMANINAEELRFLPVMIPDISIQKSFSEKIASLDRLSEHCSKLEEKTNYLFQTLLQRAFSGDLTAKWREAHMSELLAEMEQQTKIIGTNAELHYEQLALIETPRHSR